MYLFSRITLVCCIVLAATIHVVVKAGTFPATLREGEACRESSCCEFSMAKYLPPMRLDRNCYSRGGHSYRGRMNVSRDGRPCMNWLQHGGFYWGEKWERRRYGLGDHNFCRNPDPSDNAGPWCFVLQGVYTRCDLPTCENYEKTPTEDISPKSCDSASETSSKFVRPDMMYSFRGSIHYVTYSKGEYRTYNFSDASMTSFGDPPVQSIERAWNLCTVPKNDDIMSFVSSFDDEHLYVYFQRPGVLLQLNLLRAPVWEKVPKFRYDDCLDKVQSVYDMEVGLIKQMFSVTEPKVVFLLTNSHVHRCEWDNAVLKYISSAESPFGGCPVGNLHFSDQNNKIFELTRHTTHIPSIEGVITSVIDAVDEKPSLALPLLDYSILNKKSLVKLVPAKNRDKIVGERCSNDGNRSRVFRIFDGNQMDDIVRWLRNSNRRTSWVRLHDVNIRKSSYCSTVENTSCCEDIASQIVRVTGKRNVSGTAQDVIEDAFMRICKFQFVKKSDECPIVDCDSSQFPEPKDVIVCEIALEEDPHYSFALDDMFSQGNISYKDVGEAAQAMENIAASIQYQSMNDTAVLSTLVGSVQALETVNYSTLSWSGAENLVSNLVTVIDNIVDEERAHVWIAMNEENLTSFNGTATEAPSLVVDQHGRKSPASMLLTMETVMQGIVSGEELDKRFRENKNWTLGIATDNIVSVVQRLDSEQHTNVLEDISLKFRPQVGIGADDCAVTIATKFPKLMRLVSQVDRKKQGREQCNEQMCEPVQDENKFEYVSNSPVISASLVKSGIRVNSGVIFSVPYQETDIPDPHERKSKFYFSCRFLAEGQDVKSDGDDWEGRGCRVAGVDHERKLVHCQCNHTTNFAILLQVVPPKIRTEDLSVLRIISYIGETISVLCLAVTMGTFIVFRSSLKSARMVAHFHLVLALLIFHLTQLMVVFAEKQKNSTLAPCIVVTVLTHFSLLASFCWMLCEGILLHMSVISVFHSIAYMKVLRYCIGWGIPAIISSATILYGLNRYPYPTCYLEGVGDQTCPSHTTEINSTTMEESQNQDIVNFDAQPDVQLVEWCWLSASNYLVFAMAVPAILAILVNIVVLTRVSMVIAQTSKATNMFRPTSEQKKDNEHIRKCLKGAIILMPILGIPWVFGFIPQSSSHVALLYTFTVLNSLQGFFILLFYCILSSEVKSAFFRSIRKRNLMYSQNWSSTYSRKESIDLRSSKRRSISSEKSRKQSSCSELIKPVQEIPKRAPLLSTATAFSEAENIREDDVFFDNNDNRSLQRKVTFDAD